MVWIPPGKFRYGQPSHVGGTGTDIRYKPSAEYFDKDLPQHEVTISRASISAKTEVTQKEWISVMNTQPWIGKTKNEEADWGQLPCKLRYLV